MTGLIQSHEWPWLRWRTAWHCLSTVDFHELQRMQQKISRQPSSRMARTLKWTFSQVSGQGGGEIPLWTSDHFGGQCLQNVLWLRWKGSGPSQPKTPLRQARFWSVQHLYWKGQGGSSRFFNRFYREDESHNSQVSGFGIQTVYGRRDCQDFKEQNIGPLQGDTITFRVIL